MPRLTTEWSTSDPVVTRTLAMIAEFPEHSVERMELEAALHQWQAGELLREAGYLRGERVGRGMRSAGSRGVTEP